MASRKRLHELVTRPSISSENCTIDVIRDVLAGFSAENLPVVRDLSQASPQEHQNLEDAVALTYRLCEVIRAIDAKEWKPVAVEMVLEALEDIYRWVVACFQISFTFLRVEPQSQIWTNSSMSTRYSSILTHIILCDSRIFRLSISSPRFLDLVIWTWTSDNEHAETCQDDLNNRFLLLQSVLNDEYGLESLAQRLLTDPRKLKSFLHSTVSKARQANQAPTFEVGFASISHILEIVTLLSNSSANSDVWYTLLKLGYVQGMMHGITSLAAKEYTPTSTSMHWGLLCPIYLFVYTVIIHDRRIVSNFKDIYQNRDFIHLFVRASTLLIPPSQNDHAMYSKSVLGSLAACMIHPCVLRKPTSGDSIWDPFTEEIRSGEQPPNTGYILYPELKAAWSRFLDFRAARAQMIEQEPTSLCDNPLCKRWSKLSSIPFDQGSKKCSGCSSVVYCSKRCQKQDWVTFHRVECSQAAVHHMRCKELEQRYSHKTRSIHVRYLVSWYNMQGTGIAEGERKRRHPDHSIFEILPCKNEAAGVGPHDNFILSLRDSSSADPQWWKPGSAKISQTWLRPRLAAMVDEYRLGSGGRLVQGSFPLGKSTFMDVLVKLRKINGVYQGVYSVAKLVLAGSSNT